MYIEPNTNIKLLKNVPLDNTYNHTLYFLGTAAQSTYFAGKAKYNLTEQMYQRVQRGIARVGIKSENLYDCNYMMFQNTAFGNKWFYAFITGVEYINNQVSEVSFEIDVIQTWWADFTVQQCFVEREHSASDNLFENLVPEDVELGDYVVNGYWAEYNMSTMNVCALTSKTSDGGAPTGRTINGIYTPLNVIAGVRANDAASLNSLLSYFTGAGQENAIVTLYQYPAFCGDASTTTPATATQHLTPNLTSINGYTPKNKKLFSYPYNSLVVSNNNGQTAQYRWENWTGQETGYTFEIKGVFVTTPCVFAYPIYYRGKAKDYDSGLTITNFPQCAWVGDTYKAWMAQNRGTIASSILSSAVSAGVTVAGAATVNPMTVAVGATSLASSVGNIVGKTVDAQNTPPQVHGQTTCDSLNAGIGRVAFTFMQMTIKAQFARIIDDYFNMFGYATRRVKVPNINVRPQWCYTKTVGCVATGSVPADDMNKICKIYDNGITFWKNPGNVGNYSLNNQV